MRQKDRLKERERKQLECSLKLQPLISKDQWKTLMGSGGARGRVSPPGSMEDKGFLFSLICN